MLQEHLEALLLDISIEHESISAILILMTC